MFAVFQPTFQASGWLEHLHIQPCTSTSMALQALSRSVSKGGPVWPSSTKTGIPNTNSAGHAVVVKDHDVAVVPCKRKKARRGAKGCRWQNPAKDMLLIMLSAPQVLGCPRCRTNTTSCVYMYVCDVSVLNPWGAAKPSTNIQLGTVGWMLQRPCWNQVQKGPHVE